MSDLSTDALHMTSPLRTGRRVGRTIYAQLGSEPSDVDPLVATADSPVLAERIVRAVNAVPMQVGLEDLFTPVVGWAIVKADGAVRDFVMGAQPPTPTWHDLICSMHDGDQLRSLTTGPPVSPTDEPGHVYGAPAQPAVAPDTQSAVAREPSMVDHAKPEDWHDERFREGWEAAVEAVRGGGADEGGEDEAFVVDSPPADHRGDAVLATALGRTGCAATVDEALALADKVSDALDKFNAVVAFRPDLALNQEGRPAMRRLCRAAGVSPDSEDVVGEIEAAIRAMRADTETCCNGCGVCSTWGHLRCWLHDEDGGDRELRAQLIGVPAKARFDTARRNGQRFRHLHWGTVRVHAAKDWPIELDVYDENAIELNDETARELIAALLVALDFPTPAPAPAPLQLGDVVTGTRAVSAPLGTKLGAKSAAVAAVHTTGGWSVTGLGHEQDHEEHVRINEWVVLALGDGGRA